MVLISNRMSMQVFETIIWSLNVGESRKGDLQRTFLTSCLVQTNEYHRLYPVITIEPSFIVELKKEGFVKNILEFVLQDSMKLTTLQRLSTKTSFKSIGIYFIVLLQHLFNFVTNCVIRVRGNINFTEHQETPFLMFGKIKFSLMVCFF